MDFNPDKLYQSKDLLEQLKPKEVGIRFTEIANSSNSIKCFVSICVLLNFTYLNIMKIYWWIVSYNNIVNAFGYRFDSWISSPIFVP